MQRRCRRDEQLRRIMHPPLSLAHIAVLSVHSLLCPLCLPPPFQYFALGLLRPEMPGLLLELWNGSMRHVALFQGCTDGIGALVAFALVPWIGAFSDKKGRKPALLMSAISAAAPVFVVAAYPWLIGGNTTSHKEESTSHKPARMHAAW